ncbi:MAG: Trm112 family protein [Promethearchaeota archaeon]
MKPWLNEILACPMDKHYPLKLFVFEYETSLEEFKRYLDIYNKRDIDSIHEENLVIMSKDDEGNLLYKDNIIIKPIPLRDYINRIILSIDEMDHVVDKSKLEISKKCFKIVKNDVKNKIQEFSGHLSIERFEEILPELLLLNRIKMEVEINSGLILCEECNRWFPIEDTIPKMLPDEYRNEQEDRIFLSKAFENYYLEGDITKEDLKLFNNH